MAGVDANSGPVHLAGGMQARQEQPVERFEDPGPASPLQPPPAGHTRTEPELLRQVLPPDPRIQHEQDALETQPRSGIGFGPRRPGGHPRNSGSISAHSRSSTIHGLLTRQENQ